MGADAPRRSQRDRYVAVIDQDEVTDEVRDIAVRYDPLNRSGGEGFHVTPEGELHIDDEKVIEAHRVVANRIPNDAIRIVRLPAERGELVHQYGENGFRLYELPAAVAGSVVGLLGPNGVGKTTALRILAGRLVPNLGRVEGDRSGNGRGGREPDWDEVVREFRGTAAQTYLERLRDGAVRATYKPQRVDRLPERFSGTAGALLESRDERGALETMVSRLDLGGVLDRELSALSGGELQRVAVAATLVTNADAVLLDEPSSFLDVGHRLGVARAIRDLPAETRVLVVDHDLVTLDVACDDVHVFYGEPGAFGVVSRPLSARRGINEFLAGHLTGENVRIREEALDFRRRSADPAPPGGEDEPPLVEFSALEKRFDGFVLETEAGAIGPGEVIGVLGRNGLGKTTFARLLAGALEPDAGEVTDRVRVSYKPQEIEPSFDGTVGALFETEVDVRDREFRTHVEGPFDLEPLYDRRVDRLSGGELQRASVALALARRADLYLLDEPSAFLDVERRVSLATRLRAFVERTDAPCLVIDHDLLLLEYVADRAMVFEGEPGRRGLGRSPGPVREGTNRFLETVGVTFRRDPTTGRPRANKPGSRKDREQKRAGNYFDV